MLVSGGARRAIGALVILVFLVVYLVAVVSLSGHLARAPWWGQLLFYATAGIAWAFPLKPLFDWMARGR